VLFVIINVMLQLWPLIDDEWYATKFKNASTGLWFRTWPMIKNSFRTGGFRGSFGVASTVVVMNLSSTLAITT
jgi:hypothetical protein